MINMKKTDFIIPGTVIVVLVIFLLLVWLGAKETTVKNEIKAETGYEPIKSDGEVIIDLKPLGVKDGGFAFEINVNTHTVSLEGYNLMDLATLEYDNVKLKPVSALKLIGHHNSGLLVFDVSEELESFRIVIRDIPDVKERIFEWK